MSCGPNSKITLKSGTITYVPPANVLQAAGVTTTPISPATTSSNGGLQLPISGGSFNNGSFVGSINTKGGVQLSGPGGRSVSLINFSVNTQDGLVSAEANGQPLQLFQLGGSSTAYSAFVRGTLSTISNSSNRLNNPPLPSTVVASGGSALDQGLAVGTFAAGAPAGSISSTVTYRC